MLSRISFPKGHHLPLVLCAASFACHAQTDVTTWHNDGARTGQNLNESILTPLNVNAGNFGLLANVRVDGKVDAQPLYVSALNFLGTTKNVLIVVTEHDTVYAVNADTGQILGYESLLPSGETPSDARSCDQVTPEIGITATPVIDRHAGPHGTLYVVAMSKDGAGNYYQRLHALDMSNGAEEFGGPVIIQATVRGTGDGSAQNKVTFDPKQFKDRPALLLSQGTLYTSWSSHCDNRPYSGWMIAYDQNTLKQTSALDFTPNGSDASPWNAGAGPAVDAQGNIYISLGNGTFDTTSDPRGLPSQGDYGNSLVKMTMSTSGLAPVDYWTMFNSNAESDVDTDLGSGGLMLLPDMTDSSGATRHLVVAAGKDTNLYVADRDNMGRYNSSSNATLYEELTSALPGGVWSSPAYFNNRVYYGPVGQNLLSFSVQQARLVPSPVQTTSTAFGYPGTTPSISAYNTGNGIVWATENTTPAILHAYDAGNLQSELYNSAQASNGRDNFGAGNKFIVPTIANGKVYVGTQNSVGIFGFISHTNVPLRDGDYTLTNNNSGLLLDDPNGSGNPGTAMYQWQATGGADEKWFFSSNGSGFYTIQNVASGLFLTDLNGNPSLGVALTQAAPTYDDTELWSLTSTGQGYLVRNKATGLLADDSGLSKSRGAAIILWAPTGGSNQAWSIQ